MGWVNLTDLTGNNPPSRKEIEQVLDYRRRRAKARFYADENFPALATTTLRKIGAKVVTVQEVGRRRHPDENHVAYALKHGYALLTCDRDYLDDIRFPLIHCPAILVFDFGSGSPREILQAFTCLRRVLSTPQFFDKWTKIDANRASWTEYSRTLDVRHTDRATEFIKAIFRSGFNHMQCPKGVEPFFPSPHPTPGAFDPPFLSPIN